MSAPRKFAGGRLVIATHNPGKLREMKDLLEGFGADTVSAGELGLDEPEETGSTFTDNAAIKALAAATATGLPALADDSGFCVAALDGAPGVHSARWAGPSRDFAQAMRNVAELLREKGAESDEDRRSWFVAALCLAWPDGHVETVEGRIDGIFVWPPRGEQGFGYDPAFLPEGMDKTFGEMSAEEKHGWKPGRGEGLSHRARAFSALVERCFG
ncbi:MAG: RdgB/HAM1 family non-canonical purine NTP pyrophosphatase [Flavobacteriaceae bacterium]